MLRGGRCATTTSSSNQMYHIAHCGKIKGMNTSEHSTLQEQSPATGRVWYHKSHLCGSAACTATSDRQERVMRHPLQSTREEERKQCQCWQQRDCFVVVGMPCRLQACTGGAQGGGLSPRSSCEISTMFSMCCTLAAHIAHHLCPRLFYLPTVECS